MEKTNIVLTPNDALIVVDVQLDFLPNGALPIKDGDLIIPVLNDYIKIFEKNQNLIVATRDWHPAKHISFKEQGGPWPPHCIQNTMGAQFHPNLKMPKQIMVVSKATDEFKDAYSVFTDTNLSKTLKDRKIKRLFFGGLATDYCVLHSVLDAIVNDFEAVLLLDAVKGIEANPGDVEKAINAMAAKGAKFATLENFPEPVFLPEEESVEVIADKPLNKYDLEKKARMRPKGAYKRIKRERG